jgi:signal transduction histidine kinase
LEGLDTGWVDAGTRRTAYYSHLASGNYAFKVTAAHSNGPWNTEAASLAFIVLPPFYRTWWFTLSVWTIAISALWLLIRYRYHQLERARAAQQAFSRQLIAYQEGERKRIAAELHDGLGQRLIVIKNLTRLFLRNVNAKEEWPLKIDEISQECSRAIEEVREISYNLRPYQLDRLGLSKAVLALVRTASKATSAKLTAEVDDIDTFFPKEAEISFYRIVQECLTNVVKHSEATQARVSIRCDEGKLSLEVRDNGKGFTSRIPVTDPATGGFGLVGIRERAQLLGGEALIHTASGQGTTVTVHFSAHELRNGT